MGLRVYADEDGSGDLDKDELVTLVNAGQLASNVASVDATRMLHAMDTDHSGAAVVAVGPLRFVVLQPGVAWQAL